MDVAAAADEANRVIGLIRSTVRELYGEPTAEAVRIQYGGSVTARTIAELMEQPEIDGALVCSRVLHLYDPVQQSVGIANHAAIGGSIGGTERDDRQAGGFG